MSGVWNIFTPMHALDMMLDFPMFPWRSPPYGRSKRTVAQDRRAARKRAAVKRAKARGQA